MNDHHYHHHHPPSPLPDTNIEEMNLLLSSTHFAEKDIKSLLIHTVIFLMIIYKYNDITLDSFIH